MKRLIEATIALATTRNPPDRESASSLPSAPTTTQCSDSRGKTQGAKEPRKKSAPSVYAAEHNVPSHDQQQKRTAECSSWRWLYPTPRCASRLQYPSHTR